MVVYFYEYILQTDIHSQLQGVSLIPNLQGIFLAYELITTRGLGMLIGGRLTCGSGGRGGRVGRAGSGGRVGRGRILLPSADGRAL